VTADGGAFNSATLADGGTFSHLFTTTGTFAYQCAIHPSMTGAVIVSG
jgi:plastocyanin